MEYKNLGSTGLKVSRMCLGTMNFGDSTDEAEGIKLVHAAIDMGINFMDTADVYWKGKSEEILGKAIKGRREGLVIATKCWAPFDDGPNDRGSSRYHIMQAAEGALERLGVDCIDLFIMHRPDEVLPGLQEDPTPMDETLRALSDLVRQGKVRYIGTSCYPAWKIVEAQLISRHDGLERFCADQLNYSIMNRYVEKRILRVAQRQGMGVTVFSPLNYGWLSGKYHRGQEPPAGSRAARKFKITVSSPDAERNFTIIEGLAPIAKSLGVPMSQFSLAWVLANPAITSVTCGPRILAHLEDNVKALDIELDQETLDAVDRIAPPGSGKDNEYGDVMVVPVA